MVAKLFNACEEATSFSNGTTTVAGNPDYKEYVLGTSIFPSAEENRRFDNVPIIHDNSIDASTGVFVFGCITYKDQFGKIRRTRFMNNAAWPMETKLAFPISLYEFSDYNDAN